MRLLGNRETDDLYLAKKRLDLESPNGAFQLRIFGERLKRFQKYIPCDFQRRCWTLSQVGLWEANEFRQFRFYFGQVTLHKMLLSDMYTDSIHLSALT